MCMTTDAHSDLYSWWSLLMLSLLWLYMHIKGRDVLSSFKLFASRYWIKYSVSFNVWLTKNKNKKLPVICKTMTQDLIWIWLNVEMHERLIFLTLWMKRCALKQFISHLGLWTQLLQTPPGLHQSGQPAYWGSEHVAEGCRQTRLGTLLWLQPPLPPPAGRERSRSQTIRYNRAVITILDIYGILIWSFSECISPFISFGFWVYILCLRIRRNLIQWSTKELYNSQNIF